MLAPKLKFIVPPVLFPCRISPIIIEPLLILTVTLFATTAMALSDDKLDKVPELFMVPPSAPKYTIADDSIPEVVIVPEFIIKPGSLPLFKFIPCEPCFPVVVKVPELFIVTRVV